MKATYGEITHETEVDLGRQGSGIGYRIEPREIFKDPITDDGTKKSAKGLLVVDKHIERGYHLTDQVSWEMEQDGFLQTIFKDGKLMKETTLDEIRLRLEQ